MAKTTHCETVKCERPRVARGLCQPCYQRWRRSDSFEPALTVVRHRLADVEVDAKTAVCSVCGPTRIKVSKGRRGHQCLAVRKRAKAKIHPSTRRRRRIVSLYGVSITDWHEMVVAQSGRCAICLEQLLEPQVDHDHATGSVRGLLCRSCNIALGYLRDDPVRIRAALRYLG